MVILGLLLALVPLIINWFIASKFKQISIDKGYVGRNHIFALCFFLGFFGFIYVAALPDLTLREQNQQIISLLAGNSHIPNTEDDDDDDYEYYGDYTFTAPKKGLRLPKR